MEMTKDEILSMLLSTAHQVFDDDDVDFSMETLFKDIPEWDSLSHMHIVVRMEKAFGIRFQQSEFQTLIRVSDIVDLISRKMAA